MRFIFISLVMVCLISSLVYGASSLPTIVESSIQKIVNEEKASEARAAATATNTQLTIEQIRNLPPEKITPLQIMQIWNNDLKSQNAIASYSQLTELKGEILDKLNINKDLTTEDKNFANAVIESINQINIDSSQTPESINSMIDIQIQSKYETALRDNDYTKLGALSQLVDAMNNPSMATQLNNLWVQKYGVLSVSDFQKLSITDQNYILQKCKIISECKDSQYADRFQQFQNIRDEQQREQAGAQVLVAAQTGSMIAQAFGLDRFTFMDDLFNSQFGRFLTGEPSFGICESKARSSGNTLGILMDDSLEGNILAHIEGEKSKLTYPDGRIEYFYRITLQVNAKPAKEGDTAPEIRYNVDLISDGTSAGSVFKEDQKSKGSVSLTGASSIVKYSNKDYTTLCLKSSSGNTCNLFVDISQLATVQGTTPNGYSSSGSTTSDPAQNEW